LGLSHRAHARIGDAFVRGLSGGERRRVSIAVELLACASGVLLLDEPLSGLDSAAAQNVMGALEALGKAGATVALSVHQVTK
ncbi:P-loop containing nucleoside triphosphate hydrolase protein, partial [Pavlovales sp. CCMP2436]